MQKWKSRDLRCDFIHATGTKYVIYSLLNKDQINVLKMKILNMI